MENNRILVIGACSQLGTGLTAALRDKYGRYHVIAADRVPAADILLDVLNYEDLEQIIKECGITEIYLLDNVVTETGKNNQQAAWNLNVRGLLSVLELAVKYKLQKVFWPSSTAVFGPGSPKYNCPQETRIQPNTVYGISKRTGEYWCNYYFEQFGLDVRSIRFPGLFVNSGSPGNDITGYAADMVNHALVQQPYTCYLSEDNCLPLMYQPDAVRATVELMDARITNISIRTSYNIAGMSFAPCDLAAQIRKHIPGFRISYTPDHRNAIANSQPAGIRDDQARKDWGWKPAYNLENMINEVLSGQSAQNHAPVSTYNKPKVQEFFPHETF